MTFERQRGQILLIVILAIVVISTVGLSIATRSITSLKTSTEEAESQKALAAAEAGIERIIQNNAITSGVSILNDNLNNNSRYTVDVESKDGSKFLINGGNLIPKDEGADVWFVRHDTTSLKPDYSTIVNYQNYLNLYWGTPSELCTSPSNMPAAIEAIVVTRNRSTGEIKSYRYAYDSCSGRDNNFTRSDSGSFTVSGIDGISFGNRTPDNDLAKGLSDIVLVRVIPLYRDAVVGVYACSQAGSSCTPLPLQGYKISSTGTSGQASRKLTVFKGYPQTYLPYLSYGLFVAN